MALVKPEPLSASNYTLINGWWEGNIYFMELRPTVHKRICDECEDGELNG